MAVDPNYYYHYTDKAGFDAIRGSKYIKSSTRQGDMALGRGVYITDLSPQNSKDVILKNNYISVSPEFRNRVS